MPSPFSPLLPLAKLSLSWPAGAAAPCHGPRACSSSIGRPRHRIKLLKLELEPQPTDLAPPTPLSRRSARDRRDLDAVGLLLFLVDRTQEQHVPPWLHPAPRSAGGEELLHAVLLTELRLHPMPRLRPGRECVNVHLPYPVPLFVGRRRHALWLAQKSSKSVWSVRIRSTTLVRLLHGLVLLPSGISGKMIISLDTITIIAMLVVSFLSQCLATYYLYVKPPKLP